MLLPTWMSWLPLPARRAAFSLLWHREKKSLLRKRAIVTPDGYSFRPFVENRCIFVHVPKAAGISVAMGLFGCLAGGHTSIELYQLLFSADDFASYFKFSFVRNPWDRLFSAFSFLKKGGLNSQDRRWADANLSAFPDFGSFVRSWVNRENVLRYMHFVPQYRYLCLPHQHGPAVDFVGYYENLAADFDTVQQRIFGDRWRTLDRLNATSGQTTRDYRYFYDDETRAIVADVYATDIRMFGYDFDNASLPALLSRRRMP